MSGLINFIKGLFSGIFGFLGGLFGLKKKDTSLKAAGEQSSSKPNKSSNGFYLELDDAKGSGSSSATSKPAESVADSATAGKSEKKPSKRAAQLAAAKAESGATKPAEPMKASEPVAVAKGLNLPQPTVTTFATDYLLTNSSNGRRRPGANMASYLDMARKVRVPNQG
ncbi:hypothetical protein [Leptothermofonsia sp. ETS-13]|uniref:hypothetical protein n=1 Tax=Leptothermofonsia sp. ETS-13 TaxID=3035696 RepID=UPI003B9FB903